MKKDLAILGMILLLSACTNSTKSAFLCEFPYHMAIYKAKDGSTESYTFDSKYSNYDVKSSKPLMADHDISDIISIDVIRGKNSLNVGYFILLDKSMYTNQYWQDNFLSCRKIYQNELSITAVCKYNNSLETRFTYSKDIGVTSMTQLCQNCVEGTTQVLVSKYGIGKSCD